MLTGTSSLAAKMITFSFALQAIRLLAHRVRFRKLYSCVRQNSKIRNDIRICVKVLCWCISLVRPCSRSAGLKSHAVHVSLRRAACAVSMVVLTADIISGAGMCVCRRAWQLATNMCICSYLTSQACALDSFFTLAPSGNET